MVIKLNKTRRSEIEVLIKAFEEARGNLRQALEDLRDDWQNQFDGRSESWHDSDAAQEALGRIDALEGMIDDIGDETPSLDELE